MNVLTSTMAFCRMLLGKTERISILSHTSKPVQQSHKNAGRKIIGHNKKIKHLHGVYGMISMNIEAVSKLRIKILNSSRMTLLNSLEIVLIRMFMSKYASGSVTFNVTILEPTGYPGPNRLPRTQQTVHGSVSLLS